MRSLLLLLVISWVTSYAEAQVWVEDNAHWTYGWWNIGGIGGYYKIYQVGDTVLDGKSATNFALEKSVFGSTQTGSVYYLGAGVQMVVSIYNSNDSVFWWRNDQWSLLLDFSAQTGASWYIAENEPISDPYCSDVAVVTVTGFGTTNIDGTNYRYIDLEHSADSPLRLTGRYYERFGGSFFIPMQGACDPNIIMEYDMISGLRCFSDDSLSLNFVGEDCNYLETHLGISEEPELPVICYPNPSNGLVQISSVTITRVSVTQVDGKSNYQDDNLDGIHELDLRHLSAGSYLVRWVDNSGSIGRQKILITK